MSPRRRVVVNDTKTREAELRSAGVYVEKTIDVYLCTRIALLNKDMICMRPKYVKFNVLYISRKSIGSVKLRVRVTKIRALVL